jgi:RAP1 GTPase activating protein 1
VRKLGDPIVGVFPNSGARRSFSAAPSGDGEDGVGQGATTIESESSLAGVASPSLVARGRPPIERRDRVLSNAALRGVRTSTVAGGLATMRGPIAASDEHHIGERNEEVRDRFASTSAMLESLNLSGRLPNTRPPPPPPSSGGPPGPPPPAPPQHPASAPVSAQSSSTALNSSGNTENSFGFLSSLSGMLKQRKPPEEADARIRELMHIESASGVAPSSPRGARPELDEDSLQWCTPRSVVNAWVDLPEDPLVVVKDATDHIETPRAGVDIHGAALEFQDEQKRPYRDYLYDKDHMHYLPAKDADALGPIIVSLECGKKPTSAFQRGILRTKKGDVRFVVPASTSSKDRLKHLRTVVPDLAQLKLIDIKEPPLNDALLKYEDQCVARQYKFGAIMWRAGQSEDQLFANNEMPGGFELFLTMLGERIELSGWSGFRGGLDVTGGTTGTQSVFRHFVHSDEDVEIMYHVAPLLPFFEKDLQQLERKRHVGNDVVNVVFVEGDEPFPTSLITSHFTYVFIVVRLESMSPARFRVAVCAKDGVRPFGPPLPDPPVFDCNQTFSDWISAKLVNAERASMYAQTFATKMARTKTALLGALVSEYRGRK